jgi:indole-3-glycerol phosphate synthase
MVCLHTFSIGGRMKDIHEVLRQKQTKYAALGKQIEMLQQAAEKLREVAPLLAENDDEDNAVLMEVDEASPLSDAKAAAASSGAGASKAARPTAPRWP